MTEWVTVAIMIGGYAAFLVLLAALSDRVVGWWEFRRHVNQAIALTEDES